MASARKKQDEKHLKILRELVSNPQNRQCFDCHQRGPTYVNMTIGSFVCTSCSGLLRGLTPPHRVKSISMATFSPEEIELISSRGNEYCRRIWLGLHEPGRVTDARDEQGIKDFMIAKYEKKRYYLDPSMANMNGVSSPPPSVSASFPASASMSASAVTVPHNVSTSISSSIPVRPLASLVPSLTLPALSTAAQTHSSGQNAFTPDGASSGFLVDFGTASAATISTAALRTDPFGASSSSNNTSSSSNFANFDNNPVFDASNETDLFSNLPFSSFGAAPVQPSTFPAISFSGDAFTFSAKFNPNRWSMPPSSTLPSSQSFPGVSRKVSSSGGSVFHQPPAEDRYAALKDLDSLMKSQQGENNTPATSAQPDWTQAQSTSPAWSAFGSSPQPVTFLGSTFTSDSMCNGSTTSNPFTGTASSPWIVSDGSGVNPFRTGRPSQTDNSPFAWGGIGTSAGVNGSQVNGFHATPSAFPSSQSLTFPTKSWNSEPVGNPFMLGSSPAGPASGNHSSNPFL